MSAYLPKPPPSGPGGKTSGLWWLPQFLLAASDATEKGGSKGAAPTDNFRPGGDRDRGVDGLRGGEWVIGKVGSVLVQKESCSLPAANISCMKKSGWS